VWLWKRGGVKMAIEWLSGNRLRGTTSERPSASLQSPSVGGWVELGRTTLGSASDKIDVESLPNKRYYMVLFDHHGSANTNGTIRVRYNNTGNSDLEYAGRYTVNGASDSTYINELSNFIGQHSEDTNPKFRVSYISNFLNKEKLIYGHMVEQSTAGAGTSPNRAEDAEKWTDNAVISSIEYDVGAPTNSFNAGSEVVVLGWDPDDTHTTNFWEELASDTHTGADTSTFTSSTFTAKKYLWIQFFAKAGSASSRNCLFRFNSDSGSNYSHRRSQNGGSDTTQTNQANGVVIDGFTENGLVNMFVINNSSNEKLALTHSVFGETAGAGTAPKRSEAVSKWANTSSQITSVSFIDTVSSDAFADGSMIKVWGSN